MLVRRDAFAVIVHDEPSASESIAVSDPAALGHR
jgi:hypothetical protein